MDGRLPVLLWSLPDAGWFGALVGDAEGAVCHAGERRASLAELAEYARQLRERQPWQLDEDIERAELLAIRVDLRGEYRDGVRKLPSAVPLTVQLPVVRAVDGQGLVSCVLPHLGIRFQLEADSAPGDLVRHYVGEALRGLDPQQLWLKLPPVRVELEWIDAASPRRRRGGGVDPLTDPRLKLLRQVAEPLLKDRALSGGAPGRETLVQSLAERLAGSVPLLLVGPAQVGKSSVLVEAVRKLKAGREPDAETGLSDWRWWRLSGARLIAGMRYLGEWEARCEQLIAELARIGGTLAVENLRELISVGGQGPGDSVGAFLVPYLQRGELNLVAEATAEEVEACRRQLPELLDCFELVPVPPFIGAAADKLMQTLSQAARSGGSVQLAPEVPQKLLSLYRRFQPQAHVPGPPVRLLRKLLKQARRGPVSLADSLAAFTAETGLPDRLLRDELPLPIEQVEAELGREVLGQPQALRAAAQCIVGLKAGLNDPARPLSVLLFTGPSGTGKTALARALARWCFGSGDDPGEGARRLLRLDMSEYAGWDAASRLLLADARTPARWLQQVAAQPFAVLLFDEIEKAAPEVFDLLLGLLDEGRLTDPFGRTHDFRSCLVILTSNLGAATAATPGFTATAEGAAASAGAQVVRRFFRPEFFNRLDAVVAFQPLAAGTLEALLDKELADLEQRAGLREQGLRVRLAPALRVNLLALGYHPRFGARPLQRAIERKVVQPLARWRLAHPSVKDVWLLVQVGGEVQAT